MIVWYERSKLLSQIMDEIYSRAAPPHAPAKLTEFMGSIPRLWTSGGGPCSTIISVLRGF